MRVSIENLGVRERKLTSPKTTSYFSWPLGQSRSMQHEFNFIFALHFSFQFQFHFWTLLFHTISYFRRREKRSLFGQMARKSMSFIKCCIIPTRMDGKRRGPPPNKVVKQNLHGHKSDQAGGFAPAHDQIGWRLRIE